MDKDLEPTWATHSSVANLDLDHRLSLFSNLQHLVRLAFAFNIAIAPVQSLSGQSGQ